MTYTVQEILDQIEAREDSRWEFKQVEFAGKKLRSPKRDALADEIAAFANARGGVLLCGVTNDGQVQDLSGDQLAALDAALVEISTDSIKPPVRISTHHRRLPDGKLVAVVEVPESDAHHRSPGGSYIRVGGTKREMTTEEGLRLAQRRGQVRVRSYDERPLPSTGFGTLDEALWKTVLSASGALAPEAALRRLALLAPDDAGESACNRSWCAPVLGKARRVGARRRHHGDLLPGNGPGLGAARRPGDRRPVASADRGRDGLRGAEHAGRGAQGPGAG